MTTGFGHRKKVHTTRCIKELTTCHHNQSFITIEQRARGSVSNADHTRDLMKKSVVHKLIKVNSAKMWRL
jgi:hypothetical protein